jgi:hypothetical protein
VALQESTRKENESRFHKISGMKRESLAGISGECFCESGGYEAGKFPQTFSIRRRSKFRRAAYGPRAFSRAFLFLRIPCGRRPVID